MRDRRNKVWHYFWFDATELLIYTSTSICLKFEVPNKYRWVNLNGKGNTHVNGTRKLPVDFPLSNFVLDNRREYPKSDEIRTEIIEW